MPPRETIEQKAQSLLDELAITTFPVPVDRIARELGAQMRFQPLDEELSGMVYIKDNIPIIGVNALHHPHRQRFTISHEIAHLRMHREMISNAVHVDKTFDVAMLRRDSKSAQGTERIEIEANQFAAALLIPLKYLTSVLTTASSDIDDERPLEEWARKFKVSKAMLHYRIRNVTLETSGKK
jgi:Zn-dependent peptidase ImmA (M78 family)